VLDRLEDLDEQIKGIAERLDRLEMGAETSGNNP